jgi:hypothetical protein
LLASCGEENLLKLPSDRYRDHRDICTHEFAHTVLGFGLSSDVRDSVRQAFQNSMSVGLWKTAYAATNEDEFFAELSMWYFNSRGDFGRIHPAPKEGQTWLRQYDPKAFALLDGIYTGRTKVGRINWEKLAPRAAKDESRLRSLSSAQPAIVVFDNRTTLDYLLYWLDFQGRRKSYGVIHSGAKLAQKTFATHPWLVVKPDGQVAAIYVASQTHAKAALRE